MNAPESDRPLAIVCGSDSLTGSVMVSHLSGLGWDVFTVDPARAGFHPDAAFAIHGDVGDENLWASLRVDLDTLHRQPRLFVHAVSELLAESPAAVSRILPSAELGCQYVMPLIPEEGSMVFLTSVLGIWDTRADMANFAVSQAGLLGLMRAQALIGAASGVRVNAVCTGLVTDPATETPPEFLSRIPLGKPAIPDDISDAALFLLSPDARHITGSTLVVDGGQSLQSWSNAPREGRYAPPRSPSPGSTGEGGRGVRAERGASMAEPSSSPEQQAGSAAPRPAASPPKALTSRCSTETGKPQSSWQKHSPPKASLRWP